MGTGATSHYRAPSAFDRRVMNPPIGALTRLGLSFAGSRVLEVLGRRSLPRRAARPHEWVRNLRAAGEGYLLLVMYAYDLARSVNTTPAAIATTLHELIQVSGTGIVVWGDTIVSAPARRIVASCLT